jgi:hypothetical protein
MAEMSGEVVKGLFHVVSSVQLNCTVGWVEEAEGPRREVKRTGMEAVSRREARRREVLPVPPVRRMVMIVMVLVWKVVVKVKFTVLEVDSKRESSITTDWCSFM